jgi:hypothetical protein
VYANLAYIPSARRLLRGNPGSTKRMCILDTRKIRNNVLNITDRIYLNWWSSLILDQLKTFLVLKLL